MSATTRSPRVKPPFNPDEHYSTAEVAEVLKATQRAVRGWVYDGLLAEGSVIALPRGMRIAGWALNEFVAERTR